MKITYNQFIELSGIVNFNKDENTLEGDTLTEQQLEVVRSNPKAAYWYAKNIVQEPWPEGENAIRIDPRSAYYYALCCIKGRWRPGELAISDSMTFRYRYNRLLKKFESR